MALWTVMQGIAGIAGNLLSAISRLSIEEDFSGKSSLNMAHTYIGNLTLVFSDQGTLTSNKSLKLVHNDRNNPDETLATFISLNEDGSTFSSQARLKYLETLDVSKQFEMFKEGELLVTPVENIDKEKNEFLSSRTKLWRYASSIPFMFALKISITTGVFFEKTSNGFKLTSTTLLDGGELTYKDKKGGRFEIKSKETKLNSLTNKYELFFPFPHSSIKDLPYEELVVSFFMPSEKYNSLFLESDQKIKNLSDDEELYNFITSLENS